LQIRFRHIFVSIFLNDSRLK